MKKLVQKVPITGGGLSGLFYMYVNYDVPEEIIRAAEEVKQGAVSGIVHLLTRARDKGPLVACFPKNRGYLGAIGVTGDYEYQNLEQITEPVRQEIELQLPMAFDGAFQGIEGSDLEHAGTSADEQGIPMILFQKILPFREALKLRQLIPDYADDICIMNQEGGVGRLTRTNSWIKHFSYPQNPISNDVHTATFILDDLNRE